MTAARIRHSFFVLKLQSHLIRNYIFLLDGKDREIRSHDSARFSCMRTGV